MSAEIYANEK